MNSRAFEQYQEWLTSSYFDDVTHQELRDLEGNDAEIEDRFYKDLEFGTGGMRGLLGAGTNRINRYTVRRATQGLANYIKECGGQESGVVIAYDSRHQSELLSKETALCLNANGIKTYRFDSLRPTPELSFAVRELHCIAGVVITASHNPPEYNGYKVYWEDGGQITPPHDRNIMNHAGMVSSFDEIPVMEEAEARSAGLYNELGKEMDDAYINAICSLSIHPDLVKEYAPSIKIVYTPLHGAGNLPVRRVLEELGFTQVYVVKEQELPDGEFTTCEVPNPEADAAWVKALELAETVEADLVIATDPDADRIGLYARREDGSYQRFTGNMTGTLLAEYILKEQKNAEVLPDHGVVMKTIVTGDMVRPIAEAYGCRVKEVLTGFKYIGEKIREFEDGTEDTYVFGFEESFGCLMGTYARDKDAVSAAALIAEVAAVSKAAGITIVQRFQELYERYGYYMEGQSSITLKGIAGVEQRKELMARLRRQPLSSIGGKPVIALRDYESGIRKDVLHSNSQKLDLPESNVLYYELENGWCCVRPSGTEPKIKLYFGVKEETESDAVAALEQLKEDLLRQIAE